MKYVLVILLAMVSITGASAQAAKKKVQQKPAVAKKAVKDTATVAGEKKEGTGFHVAEIQKKTAAAPAAQNQNKFLPTPGKERTRNVFSSPADKTKKSK